MVVPTLGRDALSINAVGADSISARILPTSLFTRNHSIVGRVACSRR